MDDVDDDVGVDVGVDLTMTLESRPVHMYSSPAAAMGARYRRVAYGLQP
jgi:hypothetical protein